MQNFSTSFQPRKFDSLLFKKFELFETKAFSWLNLTRRVYLLFLLRDLSSESFDSCAYKTVFQK